MLSFIVVVLIYLFYFDRHHEQHHNVLYDKKIWMWIYMNGIKILRGKKNTHTHTHIYAYTSISRNVVKKLESFQMTAISLCSSFDDV